MDIRAQTEPAASKPASAAATHFDVLIVGAGLSGIGAAVHLARECPGKSYAIFEARNQLGGTWDLFRYPGIRSDSDMHTLGYDFKPWIADEAIADGPAILAYIHETVEEYNLRSHVCLGHKVTAANWSSADNHWQITVNSGGEDQHYTANFVSLCAGYYRFEKGHDPYITGKERFAGRVIHPQHWPEDLDYSGKKVAVIGSGATAVTIVPSIAKDAAHVTMIQRSPTYIIARPGKDRLANVMRAVLPNNWAYALTRKKNIAFQRWIYRMSQNNPEKAKKQIADLVRKSLGDDYEIENHFTPSYDPWDQRLCLAPDGDFFEALKDGSASIVTGDIDTITETGVTMKSGETIDCDILVTATGIHVQMMGDMIPTIDGTPINPPDHFTYKGFMINDLPNIMTVFGYTNASWTLRADLIARYMCRLLNYMDAHGYAAAVPRAPDDLEKRPWIDFDAGYIKRIMHELPGQGERDPWRNTQDYKFDRVSMGKAPIDDGVLEFIAR